jgi:hypothetical protein
MQWWNDFVEWLYSDAGWRVVSTAIVPFLAIIIAALIAVGVTRGSISRLLAREDRDDRAAAIGVFIEIARQATQWANQPAATQDHLDTLAAAASTRLRLLPSHGAAAAAEWAEHQIGKIKGNSANFSVQSEQDYIELRDRLAEWQHKPKAARRLFAIDLEQFKYETTSVVDDDRVGQQQQWAAEQAAAEQVAAERAIAEHAAAEKREQEERDAAAAQYAFNNPPETAASLPTEPAPSVASVFNTPPVETPAEPLAATQVIEPEVVTPENSSDETVEATIDDDTTSSDPHAPRLVPPRTYDV